MRKKERLAKILMQSWLEKLLSLRKKNGLAILAYHSIQQLSDDYPFNPEIISATPDMFDQQMAFVRRYFNVINFHQLLEVWPSSETAPDLPPNSLMITFDDGYADNFLTAMPILQSHDLTAIFYVSTEFVDQQKLFWFDALAFFIFNMPAGRLTLSDGQFVATLDDTNRDVQRRKLGKFLQTVTDEQRLSVLNELKVKAGLEVSEAQAKYGSPLTWPQVKGLRSGGMEVGSHSVNHGFLDVLTTEELRHQIQMSKSVLEKNLEEEIVSFSYPNGNLNQDVIKAVSDAGYKFAVSYKHSIAIPTSANRFTLPRVHVETDVGLELFKGNLFFPEIFVR